MSAGTARVYRRRRRGRPLEHIASKTVRKKARRSCIAAARAIDIFIYREHSYRPKYAGELIAIAAYKAFDISPK